MDRYEPIFARRRPIAQLVYAFCAGTLCLMGAAERVRAGEIYKSIDADGKVVYSDQLDPSTPQTKVAQVQDPHAPPGQLHFCWTNCFTLVLDNGVYRRADGTDESWTIETFSKDALVLHRHDAPADWNGYSEDVVYAGSVFDDQLVDVTVNGKPTGGISASWGAALGALPGSNAERDAPTASSPESSPGGAVSSSTPPPPMPPEDQPALPDDGSLWTPGYWYWRNPGYVWMPGAWVRPPQVGSLWTPAYWSAAGAVYVFHPGHWGSTVGFYGGVNYGYGYFGSGYAGGHWIGNSFAYNSTVNHMGPTPALHTYAESVPNQGSRSIAGSIGAPPYRDSPRPGPQRPLPPRAADKPAAAAARSSESAPSAVKAERPATVAKTPVSNTPPRSNHEPARGTTVKQ